MRWIHIWWRAALTAGFMQPAQRWLIKLYTKHCDWYYCRSIKQHSHEFHRYLCEGRVTIIFRSNFVRLCNVTKYYTFISVQITLIVAIYNFCTSVLLIFWLWLLFRSRNLNKYLWNYSVNFLIWKCLLLQVKIISFIKLWKHSKWEIFLSNDGIIACKFFVT